MEQVDVAEEVEHKWSSRMFVDLIRCTGLFYSPFTHNHNPVGHFQCLLLIMGDKDTGDMDLIVQAAQPATQFGPYLGIQGTEGLIQQQYLWFNRQCTCQCDALTLTN
jgi:hypothetical protein